MVLRISPALPAAKQWPRAVDVLLDSARSPRDLVANVIVSFIQDVARADW
jgi:hypothetical protein